VREAGRVHQGLPGTGLGARGRKECPGTAPPRPARLAARMRRRVLAGTGPEQVGTAPERVGTAPERVGMAPAQVGMAPERVGMAPAQVGTGPAQVQPPRPLGASERVWRGRAGCLPVRTEPGRWVRGAVRLPADGAQVVVRTLLVVQARRPSAGRGVPRWPGARARRAPARVRPLSRHPVQGERPGLAPQVLVHPAAVPRVPVRPVVAPRVAR